MGGSDRLPGAVLGVLLLLGGCAELRTPPPPPPPAALAPDAAVPTRSVVRLAATAFADRGTGLAGRTADTALAAARLEFLADRAATDPTLAPLGVGLELALARTELRDAIGIDPEAAADPVIRALLGAALAADATAAARALPAPLFQPGGAGSLARLAEAGPLPQAAIATQRTAEALARRDAATGSTRASLGLADPFDRVTFGLGGVSQ